jgi:magnesium-dependent phosphatase 1
MSFTTSLTSVALAVVAVLVLVFVPSGWAFLSSSNNNNNNNRGGAAVPTMSSGMVTTTESRLFSVPRVIVFDLDNTLWTPELYQLRRLQRQNLTPVAGKDVKMFEGAIKVLEEIIPSLKHPETGEPPLLAIASRTQSVEWAEDLIDQFNLRHRFHAIEIFPSHKTRHFSNIQRQTKLPFHEYIFFDDARDGKYGNCVPVAAMGVFCVHCPQGIVTEDIFHRALDQYRKWDRTPNSIVEHDGKITINAERYIASDFSFPADSSTQDVPDNLYGKAYKGIVKMVRPEKGYGFITYRNAVDNKNSRDIFFHFNGMAKDDDDSFSIEEGDEVTFEIQRDLKKNKDMAVNVSPEDPSSKQTVQFRCFSMNQPFAALLANGYKTLETRNGTMFTKYAEGTQLLLHVGQRTYPDGGKYVEIMEEDGLSQDEIVRLKSLPPNFSRGTIVAVLEIGRTYETTTEERSLPAFERKAVARGEDSGRFVTEIKKVAYLRRPIKQNGAGGVFKVRVPPEALPDGNWHIPPLTNNESSIEAYASVSG